MGEYMTSFVSLFGAREGGEGACVMNVTEWRQQSGEYRTIGILLTKTGVHGDEMPISSVWLP